MQKTITAAALAAIIAAVAPAAFAAGPSASGAAGSTGATGATGTLSAPETTTGTSGTLGRTDSTTGAGTTGSGTSGTLGTTGTGTMGTTGSATGALGTTTPGMTATATEMQPGQIRGSDLRGADVHNMQDKRIASVKDLVIDPDGRVARVVVEIEGKDVGLEMRELNIATNEQGKPHITINKTEEELRAAQEFDLDAPTATGTTAPGSTMPGTTMPPAGNSNK
jgi:sporulation protein YlmC with PRC-barrel domain